MAEEKYVLISLEDEKIEKLANVLANKTSKKILDLLAEKELSESEIAKELKLPLNTVGYNIKNLISAGLIEEKRYLWSVKGKKILFYKISNKHIVISPRKTYPSKLKSILPVVFISAIFSIFILWYDKTKEFVAENAEKVLATPQIQITEEVGKIGFKLGTLEIFLIIIWLAIVIFIILNLSRRLK